MNNQQIEEWIDANKQLAFVDENHAEHVIPMDKFRKLLKTHALVPREPEIHSKMKFDCIGEFKININMPCAECTDIYSTEECETCFGETTTPQEFDIPWCTVKIIYKRMYKAMIEASENSPELSQSESNRK